MERKYQEDSQTVTKVDALSQQVPHLSRVTGVSGVRVGSPCDQHGRADSTEIHTSLAPGVLLKAND